MRKKKAGRRDNQTGQIYQDGDRYRACLAVGTDPVTGRTKYRTARVGSHAEAVEALKRMTKESGMGLLTSTQKKTLGAFLDQWLATVKANRAQNTYDLYSWLVDDHIKPHLGSKALGKVTRKDVQALLALKATQKVASRDKDKMTPTQRTLSANTLRLIKAVLHSAFDDAIKDGLVAVNPSDHVEVPKVKEEMGKKDKTTFFTPDQAMKLGNKCDSSDLGDLFAFMLRTGTRIGEATGVRWEDLDLGTNPRVRIKGQLQRLDGTLQYVPQTKSNQDREIPLTKSLAKRLRTLKAARMVDDTQDPDGIVFLNAEGRRVDPRLARNRLAALCQEAGVPIVSPHKIRHTCATLLLAETGDLHAVQKILGHSQVGLTANLYGHATADTLRPTIAALSFLDTVLDREKDAK